MTEKSPADVAAAYFDALNRGDFAAAMALFSPSVVWRQPGANKFSGEHHGPEAIAALLGGMMEASEGTFRLAIAGPVMENGELAAVPVRFSGTNRNGSMDMTGVDLLTLRNGLIHEVHLFSEYGAEEDAFWGCV